MFHEEIVRSFDGTELYRCIDAPEPFRGTVVLLHGLGGHCRRFDEPVRQLNAAGWRVVRYDHRGHGRSGGARAFLNDYNDLVMDAKIVMSATRRDAPGPLFTCGYSMGGLVSLLLGIRYPDGLSGQIFLGACACELPLYRSFRRPHLERIAMRTSPSVGSALLSRDPSVADEYDRDGDEGLQEPPTRLQEYAHTTCAGGLPHPEPDVPLSAEDSIPKAGLQAI
mgnify:CR=1 FL=1